MITSQNLDSDPFGLITTKRQIFSSENESRLHQTIKQHSLVEQDDNNSQENRNANFLELINSRSSVIPTVKVISPKNNNYDISSNNRDSLFLKSSLQFSPSLNDTWKKGGLKIIKYVARFLYQLKTKADKLKIKLMNQEIFQILGDQSSDFKLFKRGDQPPKNKGILWQISRKILYFFQYILNVLSHYLNVIGIIYPESSFKIIWDSVVVCFIVINIFYIPMSLSFELDKSSQLSTLLFETIPSYIFIAEILLNFNTAYYHQGIIHINRSDIFFHYIKNDFIWDLLIAIPFILAQFNIPYIQFILLLRIARVKSMIQNVEDLLNAKEEVQAVLELGKLVYFLILVTHMCSCGWHLLGRIEYESYQDENSWLIYYGHYHQEWYDRYIVSLYWSVITTLTVGYGDIVPQTSIERLFVIIIAMVLCGVFGYIISTIGEILKTLDERKASLKRYMKKVNQYIKQKELNLQLSLKVRKYFEFKYQIDEQLQEQDDSVLNKLNDQLKYEVLIDIYKSVLLQSKFLQEKIPDQMINNLCQKVKQATFAPGFDLVNVYEPASKLVFILDGQVNSYFISKGLERLAPGEKEQFGGKLQNVYKKGDVIGELEFILNSSYQFHFKAQTFLQVAYIDRNDFLAVIQDDEKCRQDFFQMKEKLTYQKTYGRTCDVCKWTHRYKDCPFVFYQTNIYKIARQANQTENQKRRRFDRIREQKKRRDYQERQLITNQGIDFIINFGYVNEDQLNDSYLCRLGYGIQDFEEKSQISQLSSSKNTIQNDNSSQAPRKNSQAEKMRTSFMNNKLKTGFITNNNFTKNVQVEDDPSESFMVYNQKSDQYESYSDAKEQIYSLGQTISNNISANSIKNNIQNQVTQKTSLAGHLIRMETVMPQKNQQNRQSQNQQLNLQNKGSSSNYVVDSGENETKLGQVSQLQQKLLNKIPIEIDKMKIYEFYFPHFNFDKVLEVLKKSRQNIFSQSKKRNLKDKLKSIRINKSMNRSLNQSMRNVDENQ